MTIGVAVLACAFSMAAGEARSGLLWGANGHPLTAYPGISADEQIRLVAAAGMRSYRIDVTHEDQVDRLAGIIAVAKAHNVEILPILIPPVDLKQQDEATLYRESFDYAALFLKRFQSDVSVWELGNELENYAIIQPCEMRDDGTRYPCEWGPAGGVGPLEYFGPRYKKVAAVLRGLSEGVRSVSPTARRAIGSAGWGHTGIFDRLHDDGVAWEISVWHMYGGNPEWAFKLLAKLGKPIWVTEFDHPLGSQKDGEDGQAKGVEDTMHLLQVLAPRYDVEAAFVYELCDEPYWAPSYEAFMGLVQLTPAPTGGWTVGNRKVAYQTVRKMIALGAN